MRKKLGLVAAIAAVLTLGRMGSAQADEVRITTANGGEIPAGTRVIDVHPWDRVELTADLFEVTGVSDQAQVEDLIWSANDSSGDICDPSVTDDCLSRSNFEITDYGVAFHVPGALGSDLAVTVTSRDSRAYDSTGAPSTSTLVLHNVDYGAAYLPPTQVITSADEYRYSTFNPDYALAGQGNWVFIGGLRYWVPYSYVLGENTEWVPFRNGYWTWSEGYGWTWVSYDPWGWATDHYGIWRHHPSYGWVWRPFDDYHYEPHSVSWFYDADDTGWYPYSERWSRYYRAEDARDFDDGFWLGYRIGEFYGRPEFRYRPGFTVVGNREFTSVNIYNVAIRHTAGDRTRIVQIVNRSYSGRSFGIEQSRDFVERRVGAPIPETHTEEVRTAGGGRIYSPRAVHPVPQEYRQIAETVASSRPYPVGTVVKVGGGGRPVVVPPTSNGRGIVVAPVVRDGRTGAPVSMPARTRNPGTPNPEWPHRTAPTRPVPSRPTSSQPPAPPTPVRPAPPVHQAPPSESRPAPSHPEPAPRPEPGPSHSGGGTRGGHR